MPRDTNTQHATRNTKPLVSLLLTWFAQNARDLPWRRTSDPYAIWVSEIMLQQTQVKTVIPYWERWLRELPTIESLAKAKPERIHKLWEGLGYYTRVRNMQKAAQEIVAKGPTNVYARPHPDSLPRGEGETLSDFGNTGGLASQSSFVSCEFPNTFDDVLALPGIGRYTAGAICSIAFNQPTPILDGNVIRVLTRVFGISENPRDKITNARLWELAKQLVVHAARNTQHVSPCSHLNQSLMELGALICTPREPKCLVCPIAKHCFAFQNNRVSEFPNLEKRPTATARRFAAFVLENDGKFLVRQRPEGVVNAHLWEFPNVELNGEPVNASAAVKDLFGFAPKEVKALCTIKHSITRYRITVEAFYATVPGTPNRLKAELQTRWLALSELHKLSFPSAHKKNPEINNLDPAEVTMIRLIKRRLAIRSYVFKLSQVLPRRFGKKSFYSVEEVTKSAGGANLQMAFIAYAHAIFCSRADFEEYYKQLGVRCTYDDLRATVSRRYFGGVRDFDAARVIAATRRTNEGDFHESGIGDAGA